MYCETYDDGSWYCAYDDGSEQYADAEGNTDYSQPGTKGFNWDAVQSLAQTGAQAAVGILGRAGQTGYYIPQPVTSQQGGYQTLSGANQSGLNVSGGLNKSGIGAGINLSTNTLILIAAGVLLFMMGQGKGRR